MITGIDLSTWAWKKIKDDAQLLSLINGGVYNRTRPFNSGLQDVTVNALLVPNTVLQFSNVIINFFTPDVKVGQTFYADASKLNEVSKRIIEIFIDGTNPQSGLYEDGVYMEVDSVQDYKSQEQDNFHIISVRLKTRTINY